jgi:hypothetical protein
MGVPAGVSYETMVQIQPVADAMGSIGTSPAVTGLAVIIAFAAGILGNWFFVPRADRWGHRRVQTGLALALAGVMLAGWLWIESPLHVCVIAAASGLLARARPIANHWTATRPGYEKYLTAGIAMGFQAGVWAGKSLDAAVVFHTGGDGLASYLAQAALLVVAAVAFVLVVPPRARVASPPARLPRRTAREWLRDATVPAARIEFAVKGALGIFETYLVFVLQSQRLDKGALIWVFLPILVTVVLIPIVRKLDARPMTIRLISIGLVVLASVAQAVGLLFDSAAALVAAVTVAVFLIEPGTGIWSGRGPEEVREQVHNSARAQQSLDSGGYAGMFCGIAAGALAYWKFGVWGIVGAGALFAIAGFADGILRHWRQVAGELVSVIAGEPGTRVLPVAEAALVGFAKSLSRSSVPVIGLFLGHVAEAIGSDDHPATKLAYAWGLAGYVIGVTIAMVRKRGMWSGPKLLGCYVLAAFGAGLAGGAPNLWLFGAGLLLVGIPGGMVQNVQSAVRQREAQRGSDPAQVNAEIERWTTPSAAAIMIPAAVVGFFGSMAWAVVLLVALILAVGVLQLWFWPDRPPEVEPDVVGPRASLIRVWSRPSTIRQALANALDAGTLVAYWTPLPLLIQQLGADKGWAALWAAVLGGVRFGVPWVMKRAGMEPNCDPYHAARVAFVWSLAGPALLGLLAVPAWPMKPALAVLAVGFLVAESAHALGRVAVRTQSDRDPDPGRSAMALTFFNALGGMLTGFAIAPLVWAWSIFVGAVQAAGAAGVAGWPALEWGGRWEVAPGDIRMYTHHAPDGTLWLLMRLPQVTEERADHAWDAFARPVMQPLAAVWEAFPLPSASKLRGKYCRGRFRCLTISARPSPGAYVVEPQRRLSRVLLWARKARVLDARGRLALHVRWRGDETVTLTAGQRWELGELAHQFPPEAGASPASPTSEYTLAGIREVIVLQHGTLEHEEARDVAAAVPDDRFRRALPVLHAMTEAIEAGQIGRARRLRRALDRRLNG